jgi:hypothetical protein
MLERAALLFPTPAGRFVLEHGRWFTAQPRTSGVRKMADKQCYNNALRHVLANQNCLYVEGFADDGGSLLAQHAWAAEGDRVIDRTWRDPERALYFGVAITAKTMAQLAVDRREWSLFHDGAVPDGLAPLIVGQQR